MKSVMDFEMDALHSNHTWDLVPRPSRADIIGYRWLYHHKFDSNGKLDHYKGRIVAQGFSQQLGLDFDDTSTLSLNILLFVPFLAFMSLKTGLYIKFMLKMPFFMAISPKRSIWSSLQATSILIFLTMCVIYKRLSTAWNNPLERGIKVSMYTFLPPISLVVALTVLSLSIVAAPIHTIFSFMLMTLSSLPLLLPSSRKLSLASLLNFPWPIVELFPYFLAFLLLRPPLVSTSLRSLLPRRFLLVSIWQPAIRATPLRTPSLNF